MGLRTGSETRERLFRTCTRASGDVDITKRGISWVKRLACFILRHRYKVIASMEGTTLLWCVRCHHRVVKGLF